MKKPALILAISLLAIGAIAAIFLGIFDSDETGQEVEEIAEQEESEPALSGRIVTSGGRPVLGATVSLAAESSDPAEQRVQADSNGRFSFADLPPGEYHIDARADGHARAGVGQRGRVKVSVAPDKSASVRLILQREASLAGRIVAGNNPVEDATISLSYVFAEGLTGEQLDPFIVSALVDTDSDGGFDLPSIAPGRLQVLVESSEYDFTESHEIYLRPGQKMGDLVIDLIPGGGIRGTVVDEDGEPLRASIMIVSDATGRSWNLTTTDAGFFRLRNLDEGLYSVRVEADGFRDELIPDLFVDADEMTDRDIIMNSERLLFGQVVEPDGTPVPAALVTLRNEDDATRIQTDGNGRFELADAPAGPWTAMATSPRHDASEPTEIRRGEELRLVLAPGGTIRGRVVDASRQPVSNFTVRVAFMELEDEIRHNIRQMPTERVDDHRGVFEFGPLPSGRYRITIDSPDHAGHTTNPITVTAGRPSGPITIRLEAGSSLTGVVRDSETGRPIEGARVSRGGSGARGDDAHAITDRTGRYLLEGVPSGLQSFRVSHSDYTTEVFSGISMPESGSRSLDMEMTSSSEGSPAFAYQGIGASLQRSSDGITVMGMPPNSPARAAGLQRGDIVTAVDGASVENMTLDQVIEEIRGEAGQPVTIQVNRPGRGVQRIEVERERLTISRQR